MQYVGVKRLIAFTSNAGLIILIVIRTQQGSDETSSKGLVKVLKPRFTVHYHDTRESNVPRHSNRTE
eukprot:2120165-Rhodomonas_salina.3